MHSTVLLRRQIERRLSSWSQVERQRPSNGWLFTIRQALGMSAAQLAARLGISRQGVADLERRELEDSVTLAALRKAAEAMNSDLVYGIVPRESIGELLEEQATAKAATEIGRIAHSMRLEQQATSSQETSRLVRERTAELLGPERRKLWEGPSRKGRGSSD